MKKKQKINGKDMGAEQKRLQKSKATLQKLWGMDQSKYDTEDYQAYAAYVNKLQKFELFQECQKVGLIPNHNETRMVNNLLKEFQRYTASLQTSNLVPNSPPKLKKKTLDILNRWANE